MKKTKIPSLNRNRTFIVDKESINDAPKTSKLNYSSRTAVEVLVPESDDCNRETIAEVKVVNSHPEATSTQININQIILEADTKCYEQGTGKKKFSSPKVPIYELPVRHYSAPNISIKGEYENEYIYSGCYSGLRSNDIDDFQNCVNLICNVLDQNKEDLEFADIEIIQCADVLQCDFNKPFDQAKWLYSLHKNTNNISITEINTEANSDEAIETKTNTSSFETDHGNYGNSNTCASPPAYIRVPSPSPMNVPKLSLDVTHTLPTVIEIAEGKSLADSIESSLKSKTSAITLNNWMNQGQSVTKRKEDKSTNVVTWLSRSLGGDTRLKSANSIMTFATEMNESKCKEGTITVTKRSCHSQTECNDDDIKSFDSHVHQSKLRKSKGSQTSNWNNHTAIVASSNECLFDSSRATAARPLIKLLNNSWVSEFNDSIENQDAGPLETSISTVNRGKVSHLSACSTESAQSCALREKEPKKSLWHRFLNYFICK